MIKIQLYKKNISFNRRVKKNKILVFPYKGLSIEQAYQYTYDNYGKYWYWIWRNKFTIDKYRKRTCYMAFEPEDL